jgi:3-hydroxybutyryl-CoA dehydrogenase
LIDSADSPDSARLTTPLDTPLNTQLSGLPVLVVGAGIMGAGIAQVAALAGHEVGLFDVRPGAAEAAREQLARTFRTLVDKGKLDQASAHGALQRLRVLSGLHEAAHVGLVVEAIVEQLEAKRSLLQALEGIVSPATVLASNTSSISITAMSRGLVHPGRVVGMHFFNPVPLMKLGEVVSGLATAPQVASAVFQLSRTWGKVPVHARSTPGFIVNRIARPYYAEALALLQEQAATPEVLDACLKAVGFRMGPCELMDLIGHDTNFAVTQSVFEANFFDKRYVPSLVQRELVDGGRLGRKSGQGFYPYPNGAPALPVAAPGQPPAAREVTIHGQGPVAQALWAGAERALAPQGWGPARNEHSHWTGLQADGARLVLTDGRPAFEQAAAEHVADLAVFDLTPCAAAAPTASGAGVGPVPGAALAYCVNTGASAAWAAAAPAWLSACGFTPLRVQDTPGLVVARTLAMLINEAADAVQQGVCSVEAADAAMKLGVNYPRGPFEWLHSLGRMHVLAVLRALDYHYCGERYRVSPWLQQAPAPSVLGPGDTP